jgi:phenylpyruvate tautomerase PptA (4-oxalocrotonate tautomerase family)
MPFVEVTTREELSDAVRAKLAEVTKNLRDAMGAEDDDDNGGVFAIYEEVPAGHWANGGKILPLSELLKEMGGDVPEERKREMKARFDGGAALKEHSGIPAATAKRDRNKEILMIKSALYAAIGFAAISSIALAGDDREDISSATARLPSGTFTTSAHSDEWKIANALSAGPASITEHATVIDWPANPKHGMSHGRVLREGTNGWTCMPDVPGRPQHDPMCVDETMMKWLDATLAGKKPDIDRVGLSYMLMGEARQGQGATPAKDPSQVKEWFTVGPHVMMVLPDSAKDALRGINQDLSNNQPYTSLLSSADVATPIWVIPVAKGGDRIKEEPAK